MAETIQIKTSTFEFSAAPIEDVTATAATTLHNALNFAAQKMGRLTQQQTIERLRQGDRTVCRYWHYHLAQQVAGLLGSLDEQVKAVYICDYDATPEDLCFCETTSLGPIRMLVWTDQKSAALDDLIETLEHALVQACGEIAGLPALSYLLDVQVVNDADVENRSGYAALLSSLYSQPIAIWQR